MPRVFKVVSLLFLHFLLLLFFNFSNGRETLTGIDYGHRQVRRVSKTAKNTNTAFSSTVVSSATVSRWSQCFVQQATRRSTPTSTSVKSACWWLPSKKSPHLLDSPSRGLKHFPKGGEARIDQGATPEKPALVSIFRSFAVAEALLDRAVLRDFEILQTAISGFSTGSSEVVVERQQVAIWPMVTSD